MNAPAEMTLREIETLIASRARGGGAVFVFPTAVAAQKWRDRALCVSGEAALPSDAFIPWDVFKARAARSKPQDKESISPALRTMFAYSLLEENSRRIRAGKPPLFAALLPPEYAQIGAAFAPWLAGVLPQLAAWYAASGARDAEAGGGGGLFADTAGDSEDRDFAAVYRRYAAFLRREGLFEPAWERPPFEAGGNRYYICFPAALADFCDYEALLGNSPDVTLINIAQEQAPPRVYYYDSTRSELRNAALYIRALNEEAGIAWNDIACHVPDADGYLPYLTREFALRDIPYTVRAGKPLAGYPAGKLFESIAGCVSEGFSFEGITALLLNPHLPWKDTAVIGQLIQFGIENNCRASWEEAGARQDVWEESFRSEKAAGEERCRRFYAALKTRCTRLCKAKSFAEIRARYFAFREAFFDEAAFLPESGAVLARCIAELMELCAIEEARPALTPEDPFAFFTEHLEETLYLPKADAEGVHIFPFKTAAAAPFAAHVVLASSQDNFKAEFSRFSFLRRDKRRHLGAEERDAAAAYIALYNAHSIERGAVFTCAAQTFSAYAIPHSALAAPRGTLSARDAAGGLRAADPFAAEDAVLGGIGGGADAAAGAALPALHSAQSRGFASWAARKALPAERGGDSLTAPAALRKIREASGGGAEDAVRVSATALKTFALCPARWVFERALGLDELAASPRLTDPRVRGLLFHAALAAFFRLASPQGAPLPAPEGGALPARARGFLAAALDGALAALPYIAGNRGPVSEVTRRLLCAQRGAFLRTLDAFLVQFLYFFAGYSAAALEAYCHCALDGAGENVSLAGFIDCVLTDASGAAAAVADFKTRFVPARKECAELPLQDFQLPLYVMLARGAGIPAEAAGFFSIERPGERTILFGALTNGRTGKTIPARGRIAPDGERGEAIFAACRGAARAFAAAVRAPAFPLAAPSRASCPACPWAAVCRTTYTVSGG